MFRKILIANRGEIALRVARACRELGVCSAAVYSTADSRSAVVRYADEAVHIGPPPAKRSYLSVPNVIEAALKCGADAIHPGYGFLSEDADFAEICQDNGITFIGPTPTVMDRIADKALVRGLMADAGLPVLPGSDGAVGTLAEAQEIAGAIGYPLVVKAAAGGGGRGIAVVRKAGELPSIFRETRATAQALFGDPSVYLERYLPFAAHVEGQVLCDGHGTVLHLGERDCSLQRRKQKLVEETPSPRLSGEQRAQLGEYAVAAARAVGYLGAGTVEFLVDGAGRLTFMEINGRIQVEHPVTEMATGVDIVAEQIRIAAGQKLTWTQRDVAVRGVAIECRVNAEDPERGFRPTPGVLKVFRPPAGPFTRVDSGFAEGDAVVAYYDSLLAKLIVWAPTRNEAIARLTRALEEFQVDSDEVATTIPLARELIAQPAFVAGTHSTVFVDEFLAERTEPLR
ncbi:acetyl-CoA carboxylase biotin carboxylase subunit [Actinacidiphila oryziradicis]|uniref:biotin carboxylase n=1 Tax=Actinacidiphila oryziradicis TaxID=2571141 RepID=A0A4U0SMP5_9ACTN|nr:acetyl-CoA carboxylase biotin carboxylase subunit [Actinacidiphila oryziradicis]TKA11214.1 acetyl-CoA carboxylase biotin carboxylase subunit [Actinacidiphila oryziradicis]